MADAVCKNVAAAVVTTSRTAKVSGAISSLPASILEKSSVSPISWISAAAELWAVPTICRCWGVRSDWASTSSMPVTPIIGVRISCDIVARNDDFAWLASSATRLASTATRSASSRRPMSDSIDASHLVERAGHPLELGHPLDDGGALVVAAVGDAAGGGGQRLERRDHPTPSDDERTGAHEHHPGEDRDLHAEEHPPGPPGILDLGQRAPVDEVDEVADGRHDHALLLEVGVVDEAAVLGGDVGGVGVVHPLGDATGDPLHHLAPRVGRGHRTRPAPR